MLNITKKATGQDTVILQVEGVLTIETVTDLQEAFQELFNGTCKEVQLEGKQLQNVDFFGLQLLCSAHRTAVSKNILLLWKNGRPEQLSEAMQVAGFTRHCGCTLCPPDQDCMWV